MVRFLRLGLLTLLAIIGEAGHSAPAIAPFVNRFIPYMAMTLVVPHGRPLLRSAY
jgi:hypothetical protein